jgi:hypothetical protein
MHVKAYEDLARLNGQLQGAVAALRETSVLQSADARKKSADALRTSVDALRDQAARTLASLSVQMAQAQADADEQLAAEQAQVDEMP